MAVTLAALAGMASRYDTQVAAAFRRALSARGVMARCPRRYARARERRPRGEPTAEDIAWCMANREGAWRG